MMTEATPSTEIPRSFLIAIFAVGIALAVVIPILGIYGYIGTYP